MRFIVIYNSLLPFVSVTLELIIFYQKLLKKKVSVNHENRYRLNVCFEHNIVSICIGSTLQKIILNPIFSFNFFSCFKINNGWLASENTNTVCCSGIQTIQN